MGERLGNYEIHSELGRGGMGVVHKATDVRLGRTVAIKELLLTPGMAEAELQDTVERFRREAMAAARMSHPNIVTVFDYGQDGNRHYMAMELLEGKSLGDYLDKKVRFSYQQVVDISVQICGALDYAHQAGVVHRDIKPDNIMLNESGSVKLTDFGVARVKSDLPSMTTTGTTLGTIAYISPEQLCDSRMVDGRADIFSLGALIYEMLTFKTPFDAGNLGGTIVNIMNAAPAPMSEHNPQIPPRLEAVVLKALRKNPEERYARAAEMGHALQAALRDTEKAPAPKVVEEAQAAPVMEALPCRHCGAAMPAGSRICANCGRSGTAPLSFNMANQPSNGSAGGANSPAPPGGPGGPPRMPVPGNAMGSSNVPRMPAAHPGSAPPRMPVANAAAASAANMTGGAARPNIPTMPGSTRPATMAGPSPTLEAKIGLPIIEGLEKMAPPVVLRVSGFKTLSTFGRQGVGQGEFQQPRCLVIDDERNLLIADTENGRMQVFDLAGHFVRSFKPNPSQESYRFPRAVALGAQGLFYLTDDVDHRIFRLDHAGNQIAVWRRPREENPTVPARLLIGPTGHIYVSEPNTHRVMVYDANERLVGILGREQGLQSPGGMAITPSGNLLVLDFGASSILSFNPRGEKVMAFGQRGSATGEFAVPRDLVVDKYGNIFVSDTLNHRIQVFDPEGRFLATFGRKGFGYGEFSGPEGLAIAPDDRLIISDRGNNRIQILSIQRA